jgi:hypothetical protein
MEDRFELALKFRECDGCRFGPGMQHDVCARRQQVLRCAGCDTDPPLQAVP